MKEKEQSDQANVHVEHFFPKGYNPQAEPWKSISGYCAERARACPICGGINSQHVPSCSTQQVQTEVGELEEFNPEPLGLTPQISPSPQNVVTDGPSQPAVPNIKPPSECTDEELIQYAAAVVANERQCAPDFLPSTSFLQRRLKWGYARAVLLRDEIIRRVPSLQPTSSTQPTEGRASAEGENKE